MSQATLQVTVQGISGAAPDIESADGSVDRSCHRSKLPLGLTTQYSHLDSPWAFVRGTTHARASSTAADHRSTFIFTRRQHVAAGGAELASRAPSQRAGTSRLAEPRRLRAAGCPRRRRGHGSVGRPAVRRPATRPAATGRRKCHRRGQLGSAAARRRGRCASGHPAPDLWPPESDVQSVEADQTPGRRGSPGPGTCPQRPTPSRPAAFYTSADPWRPRPRIVRYSRPIAAGFYPLA